MTKSIRLFTTGVLLVCVSGLAFGKTYGSRNAREEHADGAIMDLKPQYLELNKEIAKIEQQTDRLLSDDPAEGRPAILDQLINEGNLAGAAEQWAADEEQGLGERYHRERSNEHDRLMKQNLRSAKEGIRLFFQVRAIEQAREGQVNPEDIWKDVAQQLSDAGITNASSEIEESISMNRELLSEWIGRYPEIAVHIDIRSIDPELVIVKIRESIKLATTNLDMRELELRRAGLYAAMPEILRHRSKTKVTDEVRSGRPPMI
ncbi:MAG: hypothetical protein AAGB46_15385 [Verrucomicrobiota bacterium]